MGQKKIGRIMALIFFLAVLTRLDDVVTYDVRAQGESQVQELKQNNEKLRQIEDAINSITSHGTKAFYGNYPIDEGFLGWIQSRYGNDKLNGLIYELQAGNIDTALWYKYTGSSIHVLWDTYCRDMNYSTYRYGDTYWKEAKGEDIDFNFVGDINFADDWYTMEHARKVNGVNNCFSQELCNLLQSADVTMVNNEFVLGDKGRALEGKDYTFRAKADNTAYFRLFGTDIVSMANNHVYDFGEEGLKETKNVLKANDIVALGAGDNIDEASKTVYYIVGGRKIAIVSATEVERYSHFTKEATEKEAGVFKMLNSKLICERIVEAKSQSDYVFAYVHWGVEGTRYHDSQQEQLARALVKAGVDLIIGGHPHRVQGVEYIDNVPVVYSLGNFWFSTGSTYTTVANVRISPEGELTLRMIPCLQSGLETSIISDNKKVDGFYTYLCSASRNVGFDKEGIVYNINGAGAKKRLPYKASDKFKYFPDNIDLNGSLIDIVGNLN